MCPLLYVMLILSLTQSNIYLSYNQLLFIKRMIKYAEEIFTHYFSPQDPNNNSAWSLKEYSHQMVFSPENLNLFPVISLSLSLSLYLSTLWNNKLISFLSLCTSTAFNTQESHQEG